MQWMSVRQYVYAYHLYEILPPREQERYDDWLLIYCLGHAIPVYAVVAKLEHTIEQEYTYPANILRETLNSWCRKYLPDGLWEDIR
jgi:hypothetical protein